MARTLKKIISPAFAALITLGLHFTAMAQNEAAKEPAAGSIQAEAVKKPVVGPKKKPAKKKKKVKLPEPASEYKFQALDAPPSYTFDKKGDPIVKKRTLGAEGLKKGKKTATKAAKRTAEQFLPSVVYLTLLYIWRSLT